MSEIIFNDQSLRYISLFERVTKARVKDCIEEKDILFFIVNTGQLNKAIGKSGINVKRLRKMFNKNIDIIEYSQDILKFIKNIFHEFKIKNITLEEKESLNKKVAYVSVDIKEKGKIIGRNSRNLKFAKEIINRYHKIDIVIV